MTDINRTTASVLLQLMNEQFALINQFDGPMSQRQRRRRGESGKKSIKRKVSKDMRYPRHSRSTTHRTRLHSRRCRCSACNRPRKRCRGIGTDRGRTQRATWTATWVAAPSSSSLLPPQPHARALDLLHVQCLINIDVRGSCRIP